MCRALEIGNPSDALRRLDDDERQTTLVLIEGLSRGNNKENIVNESVKRYGNPHSYSSGADMCF